MKTCKDCGDWKKPSKKDGVWGFCQQKSVPTTSNQYCNTPSFSKGFSNEKTSLDRI